MGRKRIEELYAAVGEDETKEDVLLVNASVTYALMQNISLWARGENLLARQYEFNKGFPMPRATFMGGVSLSF